MKGYITVECILADILLTVTMVLTSKVCPSSRGQIRWTVPERNRWSGSDNLIEGESWKHDCRVSSHDINATLWQRIKLRPVTEVQRLPDGKHVKLLQRNVFQTIGLKMSDGGRYYCKACDAKKFVGKLFITRGEAYALPNISKIPKDRITPYGEAVSLVCLVYGQYKLRWYKVGYYSDDLSSTLTFVNNTNRAVFKIPRVTESEDGMYACEIKRYIVGYTASATVMVQSQEPQAPSFTQFNASSTMILAEGEDFILNYSVSSIPRSMISWFRSADGKARKVIKECPSTQPHCLHGHMLNEKITRNSFSIKQVKYPANDNITYTCVAVNNAGEARSSFTLKVQTIPKLEDVKQRNYMFDLKGLIGLNCSVKSVNPWTANFTWYICNHGEFECDLKNRTVWSEVRNENLVQRNLAELSSKLLVKTLPYLRTKYLCEVKNALGTTHNFYEVFQLSDSTAYEAADGSLAVVLRIVIPLAIISMLILVVISVVLCQRMRIYGGLYIFSYPPMPDYMKSLDYNKNMRKQCQRIPYVPEWEFPRERIQLHSELGKGEFGCVWLAHASGISEFCPRDDLKQKLSRNRFSDLFRTWKRGNNNYVGSNEVNLVAVKKLKDEFDREKLLDLRAELKMLIHVGEHENIVNVLGACTKGTTYDLWIILEYCPNGDLRSFLQRGRAYYRNEQISPSLDMSRELGAIDLKRFASHIARGMEFLISRKVIHRDLAARNVLLGQGYVAKIADFGLARDVYKDKKYVKKNSGLLPIKWMAIESIQDLVFTEKTDIWSFGVLLWEMFTLGFSDNFVIGETPYLGVLNTDIISLLLEGERLEIPTDCPISVSNLMKQCWETDPDDRPTFSFLVNTFNDNGNDSEDNQKMSRKQYSSLYPNSTIFDDEEDFDNSGTQKYLSVIYGVDIETS